MEQYETIERLCNIAQEQADIIKKQAEIIAQYKAVSKADLGEFAERESTLNKQLAEITKEYT